MYFSLVSVPSLVVSAVSFRSFRFVVSGSVVHAVLEQLTWTAWRSQSLVGENYIWKKLCGRNNLVESHRFSRINTAHKDIIKCTVFSRLFKFQVNQSFAANVICLWHKFTCLKLRLELNSAAKTHLFLFYNWRLSLTDMIVKHYSITYYM